MKISYIKLNDKKKGTKQHRFKDEKHNHKGKRNSFETIYKSEKLNNKTENKRTIEHSNKIELKDIIKNKEEIKETIKKNIKKLKEKNFIKKNQISMFALSLMLVTAGYLNYTNKLKVAELGDAKLVSSQTEPNFEKFEKSENIIIDTKVNNNEQYANTISDTNVESTEQSTTQNNTKEIDEQTEEEKNTIKEVSSENNEGYFAETKLERNKMYSQMIETYTKILENASIPDDQKNIASNEIKNINEKINRITTIENLFKTKGIEEAIILINDSSIDVVVKSQETLEDEKVAQIQNIVSRELKAEIEDIHITTHK